MCVDLCGFDILMAQEFLDGADVVSGFEQMGGEAVAEGVGCGRLGNAACLDRGAHSPLQIGVVGMVAACDTTARIDAQFGRREDVLPAPFAVGIGVFTV
jgi:hypothetical protein